MNSEKWEKFERDTLAYFEGALDEADAAELLRLVEADPAFRQEFEAFTILHRDLEAIYEMEARNTQEIDIASAVMAQVAGRPQELAAPPAPCGEAIGSATPFWPRAAVWAAAAALACGAFYFAVTAHRSVYPPAGSSPAQARGDRGPGSTQTGPLAPQAVPEAAAEGELGALLARLRERREQSMDTPEPPRAPATETASSPPMDRLDSARAALDAWRESLLSGEGKERFERLASLSPDMARRLAASEEASTEVLEAASEALPPGESAALLMTVVGREPDNPNARFDLTKAYIAEGSAQAAAQELEVARALDPENALIAYLQGLNLLDQGDWGQALDVLKQAMALDYATTYSLEDANARAAALEAAGMSGEAARLLAALTGGAPAYDSLTQLSAALIEHGQAFESQGDMASARLVYEATLQLGQQLDRNAVFAAERVAAFDIQLAAMELLEGVYTSQSAQDALNTLTQSATDLVTGLDGMIRFVEELNAWLFSEASDEFLAQLTEQILGAGDLNILQYFGAGM